jgi:hypothetical protein
MEWLGMVSSLSRATVSVQRQLLEKNTDQMQMLAEGREIWLACACAFV